MENLREIYTDYLRKFCKFKKEDDLNQGVYDSLIKKIKVRQRLKFSMAFWYGFYLSSGHFISKTYKFSPFFKFWFYTFLIVPNTVFYYKKFNDNRKSMHVMLLDYHLKCISLPYVSSRFDEIRNIIASDYLLLYK
jgi:hypothetical protein